MPATAISDSATQWEPPLSPADSLYEIIDGERIELPPMSIYSTFITTNLATTLGTFAKQHQLGRVAIEGLLKMEGVPGRNRRPDFAFVSYERWAKDRPIPSKGNAWEVNPDLAVEVVSPNDMVEELMQKTVEYFTAGARQVWIISPATKWVHIYRSLTEIQVFHEQDELKSEELFPGWSLPAAQLFDV